MEYNSFLEKCNESDVLEFENQMVKLDKFKANLNGAFHMNNKSALAEIAKYILPPQSLGSTNIYNFFNGDGIEASILRIGSQGWKKGKIKLKVTLEFCLDEPEIEEITQSNDAEINQTSSPLDDIRQMMNKDN